MALRLALLLVVFFLVADAGTPAQDAFGSQGADVTVEPVAYEFQRGGYRMLRLRRKRTA